MRPEYRSNLARANVDALMPCFEWEGFHEYPEHEARFKRTLAMAGRSSDIVTRTAAQELTARVRCYEPR